jgi:DnaJ homolog subfamily C member 9
MDDILIAYKKFKGNMDKIYASVMLSDPVEDDSRFREIIDAAIARGDAEGYKVYIEESEITKQRRIRNANEEAEEAMAYAEELGVADKIFGKPAKGKSKASTEESLMALIQRRQQDRGQSFLDNLEAKYAPKASKVKAKKGKKRSLEDGCGEPSEEAFQAAAARLKDAKATTGVADTSSTRRSKRTKP